MQGLCPPHPPARVLPLDPRWGYPGPPCNPPLPNSAYAPVVIDSLHEAVLFVVLSILAVCHSEVVLYFKFTHPSQMWDFWSSWIFLHVPWTLWYMYLPSLHYSHVQCTRTTGVLLYCISRGRCLGSHEWAAKWSSPYFCVHCCSTLVDWAGKTRYGVLPARLKKGMDVYAINEIPTLYSFVRRAIPCGYLPVLSLYSLVLGQYFILTGTCTCTCTPKSPEW